MRREPQLCPDIYRLLTSGEEVVDEPVASVHRTTTPKRFASLLLRNVKRQVN